MIPPINPKYSPAAHVGSAGAEPGTDLPPLLHQLQLHQLELEVQNLELREAQEQGAHPETAHPELYDSAPVGYVDLDPSGQIRQANFAAATLLGTDRDRLPGRNIRDFVSPGQLETFLHHLRESVDLQTRRESEITLQDGSGRTVEAQVLSFPRRLPDGTALCRMALIDISRLKRAEAAMVKLASFPRYNPNPVVELDEHGTVTYCNAAAQQLMCSLGATHSAAILPKETTALARESVSSGNIQTHEEAVVAGRHLLWTFVPVLPHRVVHCYAADMTERLALENQVRQSQKLESIGQVAAGVAHDFNNILTIIQGYTTLLLAQEELPVQVIEPLRLISSASDRATQLTRQLLVFGRKQLVDPRPISLNPLINGLADTLRSLLGPSVSLVLELEPALPTLPGDAPLIEQVIRNMATNARDAIAHGGEFLIRTAAVDIGAPYLKRNPEARAGHFVCISFTDTGCGMDDMTASKIFEPFFTTKENAPGLGLSTVYGIVKQHQGWIEVLSQAGHGTTFKVFLPSAPRRIEPPVEAPGPLGTILLVEDEPSLRLLVAHQLMKSGFRVIEAASAVEALELWPRHAADIDLLFTDMVMPGGLTGRDLAETLVRQKPTLKVIYTSGYSAELLEQDFALERGVNFLEKPYPLATLPGVIRDCLAKKSIA